MQSVPPARGAAVVLAGGQGTRMGPGSGRNKAYLPLGDAHVVSWSFRRARLVEEIGVFVLVTRPADEALARQVLADDVPGLDVEIVFGGASRQGSEHAALDHLAPRILAGAIDVVALHDGARPLAPPGLWKATVDAAHRFGGGVPALDAGPLAGLDGDRLVAADGGRLMRVQTPQAFRAGPLLAAYDAARAAAVDATDSAGTVAAASSLEIRVVPGSPANLKVTYAADLGTAERLLALRGLGLGHDLELDLDLD